MQSSFKVRVCVELYVFEIVVPTFVFHLFWRFTFFVLMVSTINFNLLTIFQRENGSQFISGKKQWRVFRFAALGDKTQKLGKTKA